MTIRPPMIGTILLITLIILELIADIFAKQWSIGGTRLKWILAFLAYMAANAAWLWAMRKGISLSKGALIFSIASAILALIVGIGIYKEEIGRFQILGIVLGIISLFLIVE